MIWDAVSGREIRSMKGHTSQLRAISWSPNGRRIASGGYDRFVKIWDVTSGRELLSLPGHRRNVDCIASSPDGTRLVSVDSSDTKIWDPKAAYELLRNANRN